MVPNAGCRSSNRYALAVTGPLERIERIVFGEPAVGSGLAPEAHDLGGRLQGDVAGCGIHGIHIGTLAAKVKRVRAAGGANVRTRSPEETQDSRRPGVLRAWP